MPNQYSARTPWRTCPSRSRSISRMPRSSGTFVYAPRARAWLCHSATRLIPHRKPLRIKSYKQPNRSHGNARFSFNKKNNTKIKRVKIKKKLFGTQFLSSTFAAEEEGPRTPRLILLQIYECMRARVYVCVCKNGEENEWFSFLFTYTIYK